MKVIMNLHHLIIFVLVLFCGVQSGDPETILDTANTPDILSDGLVEKLTEVGDLSDSDSSSQVVEDPLQTDTEDVNDSNLSDNSTLSPKNVTQVFINCSRSENISHEVEIVNSTRLLNLLVVNPNITRAITADCLGVYFFARWCPFSTMAAPHLNALPRAFPNLRIVAVDAMKYHMFNTQYGVVGVPTFILFHNGRPAVKFNETDYTLERFSTFITKFTTIPALEKISVTSADFNGPVPSVVVKEPDFFLWLSWGFLAGSALVFFAKSSWYRKMIEVVKVTWRESEAQHDHMD